MPDRYLDALAALGQTGGGGVTLHVGTYVSGSAGEHVVQLWGNTFQNVPGLTSVGGLVPGDAVAILKAGQSLLLLGVIGPYVPPYYGG